MWKQREISQAVIGKTAEISQISWRSDGRREWRGFPPMNSAKG